MRYVPVGDTFYFKFTTRQFSTGAPFALAGTPVISAYEDANLTQITAGITLTEDYDGVTGLNHVAVVATGANGYETGKHYALVITTGTVDSVSVVGEVVHEFVAGPCPADVEEWLGTAVLGDPAGVPSVNLVRINGSATTFANFEDVFDNTGYDMSASTVGTVTTLTGHTAQTGDTFALANGATGFAAINTDVEAILADTGTDGVVIAAAQTVATVTDVTNTVNADMVAISTSTTAADNLEASALGIISGATSGTPTTTSTNTDLTGYADDELIGRVIVFTGGTANGQAATITDYANTNGVVSFAALTTAPAASDAFVIV